MAFGDFEWICACRSLGACPSCCPGANTRLTCPSSLPSPSSRSQRAVLPDLQPFLPAAPPRQPASLDDALPGPLVALAHGRRDAGCDPARVRRRRPGLRPRTARRQTRPGRDRQRRARSGVHLCRGRAHLGRVETQGRGRSAGVRLPPRGASASLCVHPSWVPYSDSEPHSLQVYLLTLPFQLLSANGIFVQGSTALAVLTALYLALLVAFFCILLANAIITLQVRRLPFPPLSGIAVEPGR